MAEKMDRLSLINTSLNNSMKTLFFFMINRRTSFLLSLLITSLSNAQPLLIIQSDAKSNITACGLAAKQLPTTADVISYMFSNVGTNEMTVYLPPRGQHLCKVEMVNEKGEALPKTKLAVEMESRFYETTNVLTYKERVDKTGWTHLSPYTLLPGGGTNISFTTAGGGMILELYRPDQLFERVKPGKYTLTLTFQVIKFTKYNTGDGVSLAQAITLPSVKIPIIKPEN
jgi:hypothetical protein